ncbi:hypothetical protein DV532_25995 (plasmid) [Pseudomonas sp. Leaf58]|uniref:hypothetical protein n=1 Tax=Pseudomonas sp. Leaf58 TaxID=1736226 RepID=UPI0006FD7738|nr:hypothetical protein [Pseudomonas sp. Leaf58]AYG47742.1 hypothetical protein DV532_25995 [Pseudomonas sp. Leaf58]KQN62692.1 hypothetical protein ASF02_11135 [Pseudomonas sp. Leaf58]
MNIPATLPSYALIKEVSGLDPDRLRDGSYQREAMDFFSKVVQEHGNTNLSEVYNAIFEVQFGKDSLSSSDRLCSPFLCMTVALVAVEDIGQLKHCTLNDNLPLGQISRLVGLLANRVEVDYVQQFENCGELSLDLFLMLYCTGKYHFALKVVMDDNPRAFAKLQQCDPSTAVKALAQVPYDPLSNIRVSLPDGSSISEAEMVRRYKNQVSALYSKEHMALLNPAAPCKIRGSKLEYTTIPSVDHKIALLPGYLELLGKEDSGMLLDFGFLSRMEAAINADQHALMVNLMLDFEKAGISRSDILNIATLNYEDLVERFAKTSTHLATDVGQSFKEYSKQAALSVYRSMTPEQRHALYLEQLMTKAVEYGEDPTVWQAQAKLRQINHLIRQEPREILEPLCTQDVHWNALYRATGDKRYLQKLESQLDRALAEDLGL